MGQAIHIFKKDVGRLRYHVSLTLLAAAAFSFMAAANANGPGPTVVILAVSWWFLIAAVIHLEPLPGTGHFWLTRPYRRSSLFAAKALFITAFVNVPLFVADIVILHATGFAVLANMGGLVWTQVLIVCAFEIPTAVIASITSGLLGFLTATLFLVLIALASYVMTSTFHISLNWQSLEWVRGYVALCLLVVVGASILFWQYVHRATVLSRVAAVVGSALALTCAAAFPWKDAFMIQSWLSGSRAQASTIRMRLDSERQWAGRVYRGDHDRFVAEIPVAIDGVPRGESLKVSGVRVTAYASDGRTISIKEPPPDSFEADSGMLSLRILMPEDGFRKYGREALRLKGLLYFALCAEPEYSMIEPKRNSVPVPGVGLCRVNDKSLVCDSVFRPSTSFVQAELTERSEQSIVHLKVPWVASGNAVPFPAAFNIDPVFRWSSETLAPITNVVLQRSRPIAYAVRSFELDRLVFANFKMQN